MDDVNYCRWHLAAPEHSAMDLVRIESGNHRYRRNLGGTFSAEIPLSGASGLAMSSVRMLDLDGDSGAEMVTRSARPGGRTAS
jgi:hypothetical protein